MIKGRIVVHEEPKKYSGNTSPNYHNTDDSENDWMYETYGQNTKGGKNFKEMVAELEEATELAKAAGYTIERKVMRGYQYQNKEHGTIIGYAKTIADGFDHQGDCSPVQVKWQGYPGCPNGFTHFYSTANLRLVTDEGVVHNGD